MSRKRSISQTISRDERVADVAQQDHLAAALYPWFLLALDDWGRAEYKPGALRLEIIPAFEGLRTADVERFFGLYFEAELLIRYGDAEREFIAVRDLDAWYRHQPYIHAEKRSGRNPKKHGASKFPCPPQHQAFFAALPPAEDDPAEPRGVSRNPKDPRGTPKTPVPSPSPKRRTSPSLGTPSQLGGLCEGDKSSSSELPLGEGAAVGTPEKPKGPSPHDQVFAVFESHGLPKPGGGMVACWVRDIGLDGTLSLLAELGREGLGRGELYVRSAVVKRLEGFRGKNTLALGPKVSQREADDLDERVMERARAARGPA